MAQTLQRTPLHDRHVALGARMVPFAGWEMPVQYEGVIQEHRAVRTDAGVFDVSHMGEIEVEGPRARELLQGLLSNDLDRLEPGEAQYTLLTNERRRDHRRPDRLPARRVPLPPRRQRLEPRGRLSRGSRSARSAAPTCATSPTSTRCSPCRGRRAIERLGLPPAPAFTFAEATIDGVEVMVNRTGYTGEDGCELLCMGEDAVALWDAVLARGVVPCGLGARDTLRLEVCYPLHGNDIGPDTDAISAGLGWTCALDKEFTGVEVLRRVKDGRPRAPARRVRDGGEGDPAPGDGDRGRRRGDVRLALADARRRDRHGVRAGAHAAKPDTELTIDVRGKPRAARVVKKPIYKRED